MTNIEEFVNCIPAYEGGKIEGTEQHGAALCLLRLHQINGINKGKEFDFQKSTLFCMLIDELSRIIKQFQRRMMGMTEPFVKDCLNLIHRGMELHSNQLELKNAIASYFVHEFHDNNLRILMEYAKNQGVDIPEGSWEVMKQSKMMVKPRWRNTKRGWTMYEDDKLVDYYGLKQKTIAYDDNLKKDVEVEIKIFDAEDLLFWCPKFKGKLVEKQIQHLKWKKIEEMRTQLEST